MEKKYINLRQNIVGFVFMVLFAIISTRAVQVQVYEGPWLSKKASDQYEKSFTSYGRRGIIYDRNFREMAVSIEVTSTRGSGGPPGRASSASAGDRRPCGPAPRPVRRAAPVSGTPFSWGICLAVGGQTRNLE